MRLSSIYVDGVPTAAVVTDDGAHVPVTAVDPSLPATVRGVLEQCFDDLQDIAAAASNGARGAAVESPRFAPVLTDAHAIWCAILNYPMHVSEGDWPEPEYPGFFLRHGTSLVGHGESLLATKLSDTFDYEGELAVVIGKKARAVAPEDAWHYIAGYTCFNDGSIREWQRHTSQITAGKNFECSGSFGPYLVHRDAVPDIDTCRLRTRLNGEVMQDAPVGEMIFSIGELISYLSKVGELQVGDVIACGTPGGVGARQNPPRFMHPGDTVEVEIEHVGLLSNLISTEVHP